MLAQPGAVRCHFRPCCAPSENSRKANCTTLGHWSSLPATPNALLEGVVPDFVVKATVALAVKPCAASKFVEFC
jgi:hypothetical protein